MSCDENKTLVRRYYEEVVSTGALDAVADFISPDYVEVHDNGRYPVGVEGAKEHIRGVRQTYADLRLTVQQQIAEGEWVVTRLTMRGIHRGEEELRPLDRSDRHPLSWRAGRRHSRIGAAVCRISSCAS